MRSKLQALAKPFTKLMRAATVASLTLSLAFGPGAAAATSFAVVPPADTASEACISAGANCYTTVQAAIDHAASGDTITVSPGTYAEDLTINTPNLTLASTGLAASTILSSVTINAGGVTIDGFSFNNAGVQARIESSGATLSGVVIENNIFSGYVDEGIITDNAGNIKIQNNNFSSPGGSAQAMQIKDNTLSGGCSGTQVLDNTFTAATNNGGADLNFFCTDSNSSNVTISGNSSSGVSGGSSFVSFSGITGGITVSNNVASTDGSAIFFFGDVSGSVLIDGNTITGGGGSAVSIHGDGSAGPGAINTGVFTITNNDLSGNAKGVSINAIAMDSNAGVQLHGNNLSGNSVKALANDSVISVNGSDNWWGSAYQPTIASVIAGSASYSPYYVDSGMSVLSSTTPTTTYVDPSYVDGTAGGHAYGYDAFTTISDAVAAVAGGGTVNLAAGTYNESDNPTDLSKSVTIAGPNAAISPNSGVRLPEAVITSQGTGAGGPAAAFRTATNGLTLVFKGLEFNTPNAAMRDDYQNTVTLQKNLFENSSNDSMFFDDPQLVVDDNQFTGSFGADTIQVGGNYPASSHSVSITNNTWTGVTGGGALNLSSVTGSITGNTFHNVDYYGLLLANSSGNVTISQNTFDGIANPDPGTSATWGAGVRFYDPAFGDPVTITDNTFENSYLGVAVRAGADITGQQITVIGNSFSNNSPANALNAGTGTLNAEKNWWGDIAGPGTIAGVDTVPFYTNAAMTTLSDGTVLPDPGGNATSTSSNPQVVASDPNLPLTIAIAAGNTDPSIDLTALQTGDSATLPQTTVTDSAGNSLLIPDGTVVTGPASWNGVLNLPRITTTAVIPDPDFGKVVSSIVESIEIGLDDTPVSLSQAAKLSFPGAAGDSIGWSRSGAFHQITDICDSLTAPTLAADADCKIVDGNDLVVWTKHFTRFTLYTQSSPGGFGGGGGSNQSAVIQLARISPVVEELALENATTAQGAVAAVTTTKPSVSSQNSTSNPSESKNTSTNSLAWLLWVALALVVAGGGYAAYRRRFS